MEENLQEKLMRQLHITGNLIRRRRHHHGHVKHGEGEQKGHGHSMLEAREMHAQYHLLALLRKKDGRTQKELGEHFHIRPASLSELIDKLEQAGFVERKTNEQDKRMSDIFLTEQGKIKTEKAMSHRQDSLKELFNSLSDEDQEQLYSLLSKFNESLDKSDLKHHHGHGCGHGNKHLQK